MIEELSTVALSVGWAVISIAVATIIYVGFDFGFTLEAAKLRFTKCAFLDLDLFGSNLINTVSNPSQTLSLVAGT